MYDGMKIYRAIVTSSSSSTGEVYVSIPSVLGTSTSIAVSKIGRSATAGVWDVPVVGTQTLVAVEDDKFSNVYIVYPVDTSFEIADGAVTTAKLADGAVTTAKLGFSIPGVNPVVLKVRRVAAQTITGTTATMISFDTEDSDADGFITATSNTITVPANKSGMYSIACKVNGSTYLGVSFQINGAQNLFEVATSSSSILTGGSLYLNAGDTIKLRIESNTTTTATATLWMTRIMD